MGEPMTETVSTTDEISSEPTPPAMGYGRVFLIFLGFGFMAWGGPVAQIAMIRRELVDERRWISSARFNRLLAVMQVLPGPEAHELCVHLGMRAKGRVGGLLAGLGFMLPGFLLMLLLSWAYFALDMQGTLIGATFLGVQAAVIALIVRAVHRIGEHVLLNVRLWAIAAACGIAALAGAPFWITLPAGGAVYALLAVRADRWAALVVTTAVLACVAVVFLRTDAPVVTAATTAGSASLSALFASGLKAGLLTFGGAYTAIPFVRNDAVGQGWMNDGQFLDGLALSGILPAPLIIFATFVGYVAGGPLGAVVMTAGVFLPAFAFSLLFYDRLETVLEEPRLHALLEGVAAAVVGLIAATTLQLAVTSAQRIDPLAVGAVIFAVALAVLYLWKSRWNVPVCILAAGAAGALLL
ncbi:chromate efflux transporter [Brevundimonas sp. UBA2416]|uniref:chromate efflux transporter n=1 Tax=Brevundimonas sp. UBA2416 TaxID=1946124 RepID=UPI0025B9F056|nr:chromate efflux transporter [Brevundimonas sp. UBA2416]